MARPLREAGPGAPGPGASGPGDSGRGPPAPDPGPSGQAPTGAHGLSGFGIFILVALTLVWGSAWPAMKIVVGEMPVWTFRAVCLVFGAAAFFGLALARGEPLAVPRRHWGWLIACAICNILIWQILSAFALTLLPSGRTAILGYTMPFWAAVLSAIVLGERLGPRGIVGLGLGFLGLGLLVAPAWNTMQEAPLGVIAILTAAVFWALGTVLLKLRRTGIPVMTLAAWQVGLCAPPAVVIALAVDSADWSLSTEGWMALAFVLLFAVGFAYWAWFTAVELLPASIASIGMLATPALGVWAGAIFLGERVGVAELVALGAICAGLALVLIGPRGARGGGRQSMP